MHSENNDDDDDDDELVRERWDDRDSSSTHKPSGRLPSVSARPVVTFSAV